MKTGIVIETNAEYHGYKDAISKSRLANMSVCPSYYKWCEENPQEPSDDLIVGSAFHKIVLEPETFYDEFAVMPNVDRRTTKGKMEYAEFIEQSQGKSVINQDQFYMICAMRDSVMSNKYAKKLIQGNIEQSFYFVDDLTKEPCKCRPDVWRKVADRVVIIDLKSCKSALPLDFCRDVVKYHYDLQCAMYRDGVSKVLGVPKENIDFVFIACEKKAPFLVNVMQADTYVIQNGEAKFREYIGTLKECKETSVYYGLNGSHDIINNLSLPNYLLKEIEK